jgi:predicted TIM-barrel fold metal-dependent hydrolase
MTDRRILDALFSIPKSVTVAQLSDCVPFTENLAPQMKASGIAGAVLAPRSCAQCHHQWNCADRRTDEVLALVSQNPVLLRGLASYDSLRIGASLHWIEQAINGGGLCGAYAGTESCPMGLSAPRMYPLYGLCAMLDVPVVLDFTSRERWLGHRSEVEVVAADFPDLQIILAPPPLADSSSILRLLQRFTCVSFVLSPLELQIEPSLSDCFEMYGSDRILFCSSHKGWAASAEAARTVPLSPPIAQAYLYDNAARLFGFPMSAARVA